YAFRTVLYMSDLPLSSSHNVKTIAEQLTIPPRFASKILQKLKRGNIIKSFRGVYGGYSLNRPPEEIDFLQVLEAIDGPVTLNRCLTDEGLCSRGAAPACYVHQQLKKLQSELCQRLQSVNFGSIQKSEFCDIL
ncbi:MAG: RrF2 family transcriptional regulator, partial [Christensenellales bacterium]